MRILLLTVIVLIAVTAAPSPAWEMREYQADWDYGTGLQYDLLLQYYYYIPCPTFSWFWGASGWESGATVGTFFTLGDVSMGGFSTCDELEDDHIFGFSFLDFAGYGVVYPGLFTVEFDIYCSDYQGCPVGPPRWTSSPVESSYGWNYVSISPSLSIVDCCVDPGPPPSTPRILVVATHTGSDCTYPSWGMDNIGSSVENGCEMHERGCYAALYPRPYNSHYQTMHSGYYGVDFEYCPPRWFPDGRDTSLNYDVFGFLELPWRLYVDAWRGHSTEPCTWGSIKSMYR